MIGNLKKWKEERLELSLEIKEQPLTLSAQKGSLLDAGQEVVFSWDNPNFSFAEILEAAGNIPIPPYLNREAEEQDLETYQTVYSKIKGSVAAPTAGLHFTDKVFRALSAKHIDCEEVTLHVGAGTFQPVKAETIGGHLMHTEHFSVSQPFIDRLASHDGKVIAVGTTSVRTLESLYHIARKIAENPAISPVNLAVSQWEAYHNSDPSPSAKKALTILSDYMLRHGISVLNTSTQIIILPGYQFRIIAGIVTNFHQPQSTLLLLISALLGDEWKRIYHHALNNGYRFLSYGDSNLYML
jgi:S-adenosylmethionine:tRNA ribosyltransferase-isomerase